MIDKNAHLTKISVGPRVKLRPIEPSGPCKCDLSTSYRLRVAFLATGQSRYRIKLILLVNLTSYTKKTHHVNQFRKESRQKRSLQILKAITRKKSHIDFCLFDSNLKTSNVQNARRLVEIHRAAPFPSISDRLCDACFPIAFLRLLCHMKI